MSVRATPHAARDALEGVGTDANGRSHLKVKVRAIADKGAANAAVCLVLAKVAGVAKSNVQLVRGATDRLKTVHIQGAPDLILTAVIAGLRPMD